MSKDSIKLEEEKKKEQKLLIDQFFSMSKNETEEKDQLIEKIRKLEREIQTIHNKNKLSQS